MAAEEEAAMQARQGSGETPRPRRPEGKGGGGEERRRMEKDREEEKSGEE